MPDPSTPRISLYKSKSDGSELVNYSQDLGQNWDKVDAAIGFAPCTSSTRPSTPYQGKGIMQTDTAYSTYVHNGTSPASAGWIEIPNSSAAYSGRLITLYPGSTSSSSLMRLAQTGTATGNRAFATRGSGDTADHFFFDFDGKMQWSPGGSASGDTNLYRNGAGQLKTDGALVAGGTLTASNFPSGAWSTWTPNWTTSTGLHLPSYGNATVIATYTKIGRCLNFALSVQFGSTTVFGASATTNDNWLFSLPPGLTASASFAGTQSIAGAGRATQSATLTAPIIVRIDSTGTNFSIESAGGSQDGNALTNPGVLDALSPWTWASGAVIQVMGTLETTT